MLHEGRIERCEDKLDRLRLSWCLEEPDNLCGKRWMQEGIESIYDQRSLALKGAAD